MDKHITSKSRDKVTTGLWKNNISEVLNNRLKIFGTYNISYYLPFGAASCKSTIRQSKHPYELIEKLDINFGSMEELKKSTISRKHYMLFSVTERYKKREVSIELTFPGKVNTKFFNKNKQYFYTWTNNKITVRKLLSTTKPDEIEEHIKTLLYECKKFHALYC